MSHLKSALFRRKPSRATRQFITGVASLEESGEASDPLSDGNQQKLENLRRLAVYERATRPLELTIGTSCAVVSAASRRVQPQ